MKPILGIISAKENIYLKTICFLNFLLVFLFLLKFTWAALGSSIRSTNRHDGKKSDQHNSM